MQRALPDQKKMMLRFWPADLRRELTAPSGGSFPSPITLEPNLDNYYSVVAFFSDIQANMAFQTYMCSGNYLFVLNKES